MAVTIHFNATDFRALFQAFADNIKYPDPTLSLYWDTATAYITDKNGGCYCGFMTLAQQTLALNQMTAHLLALNDAIIAGNTPGVVTGATIDKVSVTIQPPPDKNSWAYWLNQTPYGQALLALLQTSAVGGAYFGGFPIVGAFRR